MLLGNNDGTFQPAGGPAGPQNLTGVNSGAVVADFNGDGNADVAYVVFDPRTSLHPNGYQLFVQLGRGDGTFGPPAVIVGAFSYAGTEFSNTLAVGDFNGDGNLDLILNGTVIPGNGNGSFSPSANAANSLLENVSGSIAVGDFNGDGRTDFAVASAGSRGVNVFLGNLFQLSATSLTSSNPAGYGQSLTLTATASPPAATGTVRFYDTGRYLGTGTLINGQTTFSTTRLQLGAHSLTAVYSGDNNFLSSTSPTLPQTVTVVTPHRYLVRIRQSGINQPTLLSHRGHLKTLLLQLDLTPEPCKEAQRR